MVGLCHGMLLLCAQRARQGGRCQDSVWENMRCKQFMDFLLPFVAKVSYKPISSKTKRCFLKHVRDVSYKRKGGTVRRFAHRGLRRPCEPVSLPILTSNVSSTRKSHKKESCLFPCADGSLRFFDLPQPPLDGMPASGNPEQDAKRRRGYLFEEDHGRYLWSMSGDPTNRHHEVHGTKMYISHSNEMRRCDEASIDNASEHTLNDDWNGGREVLLAEEWMGTTRFQILRMKHTEG